MNFPSLFSILSRLLLGSIIAAVAYRFKALSLSGAIAAAILGTIVFGLGGIPHTVVLLVFFTSSTLLSKLIHQRKTQVNEKYAKGSRRDAWQVWANGGVAGVIVLMGVIFLGQEISWWMFCAALAAANADTWATELGVFSPEPPRLITNWRVVEMGTSGGISLTGTVSALAGSTLIALTAAIFKPDMVYVLLVAIAGLAGSLVDSWIGASIQAIYYCESCRKETEKYPLHGCGTATRRLRGLAWVNNDVVNTTCTLSASLITLSGLFLL